MSSNEHKFIGCLETESNDLQLYSGVRNEAGQKYFTKNPLHVEKEKNPEVS